MSAALLLVALAQVPPAAGEPARPPRVALRIDTAQAEAVLAIAGKARRGEALRDADWERLFASEGQLRLERREQGMGRALERDAFRAFVLAPELAAREASLATALAEWRRADLDAAAGRALLYLPDEARIAATVFPVIKPQDNSFVFEPGGPSASVFLWLDPAVPRAKFENTVAHELHHIGFASLPAPAPSGPPARQQALRWVGAFGEGFAMLAAAGGPDVHPHASSGEEERARWDRDVARFDDDLERVERFFLDVLDGKFRAQGEIDAAGFEFFGVQGPWYTVGWRIAVTVERRFGRGVLIEGMRRPERLLATFNEAALELESDEGSVLRLWSQELLDRLGAQPLER